MMTTLFDFVLLFQRRVIHGWQLNGDPPYYVFKSPKCLGMPCFQPTEISLSTWDMPVGMIMPRKSYTRHKKVHRCMGFHSGKCPENFDQFDLSKARSRAKQGWSWRKV